MTYQLIKFHSNWADEFDVDGFTILTTAEYELICKIIEDVGEEIRFNYNFGTNEGWEDDDTVSDVWDYAYTATEISEDEARTIYRLFLKGSSYNTYGIIPTFFDLIDGVDHPLVNEAVARYDTGEFDIEKLLS